MNITFTNISGDTSLEQVQPASKFIPDWYKNIESYVGGAKTPNDDASGNNGTVKRCMPVFDAINAGYIITSPADVYVSIVDGKQHFKWAAFNLISFHPIEQALEHPLKNGYHYPKWQNPWAIRTPKGYSTMFVQPMHRESVFTILPGIVDTDEYYASVNFPFVINNPEFEGLIPKGTPIAQVIPFKRDSWTVQFGTEKEYKEHLKIIDKLQTRFFDRYKTMFRQNKEYK